MLVSWPRNLQAFFILFSAFTPAGISIVVVVVVVVVVRQAVFV